MDPNPAPTKMADRIITRGLFIWLKSIRPTINKGIAIYMMEFSPFLSNLRPTYGLVTRFTTAKMTKK
jgi:hypothetical protein